VGGTVPDVTNKIPGWFNPADVTLFRWFLERGGGDVAEIGPYLGKSAVVIGEYVRPGETFTVIDLFGQSAPDDSNAAESVAQYPGLTRAAFESNYRAALGTLPVVVQAPSSELPKHAEHGTHRFVHVDGSHLYEHVAEDIATARLLLQPDGIVVLDDITSSHTPGVWAAAWEAVVTGGLLPVVVTEHKLYATFGDYAGWQERFIGDLPQWVGWEQQQVLGRPLLRVWNTEPGPSPSLARRIARRVLR
jgi:hypothetical protein